MELSQAYPLDKEDEGEDTDDDDNIELLRPNHRMRIDSSSSEDSQSVDHRVNKDDTTKKTTIPKIRRCAVWLKSIGQHGAFSNEHDAILYTRRQKNLSMEEEINACLNRENALAEEPLLFQRRQQITEKSDDVLETEDKIKDMMVDVCTEKESTSDGNFSKDMPSTSIEAAAVKKLKPIIKSYKSPTSSGKDSVGSKHKPAHKPSKEAKRRKTVSSREGTEKQPQSSSGDLSKRQRSKSVSARKELMQNGDNLFEQWKTLVEKIKELDFKTTSNQAKIQSSFKAKSPVQDKELNLIKKDSKLPSDPSKIRPSSKEKSPVQEKELRKIQKDSKTTGNQSAIRPRSKEKSPVKEKELNKVQKDSKTTGNQSAIRPRSKEKSPGKEKELNKVQKDSKTTGNQSAIGQRSKEKSPVMEKELNKVQKESKTTGNQSTIRPRSKEKSPVKEKELNKVQKDSKTTGNQSAMRPHSKEKSPSQEKESNEVRKKTSSSSEQKETTPPNSSGPRSLVVIDAPCLPTGRGKLRGVSAQGPSTKDKILKRQRSLDCQAEMKSKWYQKSKDKKKDDEKLRENRKEVLKKLADDKKSEEEATSTAQKRKFNNTKVPKLNHTNRGAFLTETSSSTEVTPPAKKPKLPPKTPPPPCPRRDSNDTFCQQLQAANDAYVPTASTSAAAARSVPAPTSSVASTSAAASTTATASTSVVARRPPERRDAAIARSQKTCNRVTFASMEREFELRKQLDKQARSERHVRFNLVPQIKYIEALDSTNSKIHKDALKQYPSVYEDRRQWSLDLYNKRKRSNDYIGLILKWCNEWLKVRSADVVAESDVLVPIPNEFKTYRQYKETFVPLMKLELLTTIERDYKQSTVSFEVYLKSFTNENESYMLYTRTNHKMPWHNLCTLSNENKLQEVFACLSGVKRLSENSTELVFRILKNNIPMKKLSEIKTLTARAVVDNLRVELGALEAISHLGCSPLFHRILTPSEHVQRVTKPMSAYKGYRYDVSEHQRDIVMQTSQRVIDDGNASITLIQGPPGTGKSMVLSNLCLQCLYGDTTNKRDRKILICAHSNTAVDNIVSYLFNIRKKMSREKFGILRFGWYEKMSNDTRVLSIEHQLEQAKKEKLQRLNAEQLEQLKYQLHELKKEIKEIRDQTNLNARLRQQLEQKEKQCRHIQDQLNPRLTQREEFDISLMCVRRANIVCTTLSSCVKLSRFINYFDICIIDEATQCTEPWTLLPLRFAVNHLVLVGDTQQLPATVISQKAQDFGLANSMFDRIQRCLNDHLDKPGSSHLVHTKVFKLSMQYRMHPEICRWPNRYFYEDQLVNSPCALRRTQSPLIPYCVINLSFTQDTNCMSSRSVRNNEEARFVANLLIEMNKHMSTKKFDYGLISPYSSQCYALSELIPGEMKIIPTTVDSYQGMEQDIIVISNARTRGCGFLTNYQRLNVALTRAKRCLIICGNFDDLQSVDMWRALLNDARDRGIYFDLKREDTEDLRTSLMPKLLTKPIDLTSYTDKQKVP
ncbi:probable helicase senataxin isoform X2 [Drosophila tropicalis]|uniref:probable helicase senataxin isoform X2 n=1 Tax=Drosophila tropicalis TaxID=46794 RepID=UPI0035AC0403